MTGEYLTNVDIANRALQRVGARRIAAFTDNNKSASETSFCYDKLRRAELQRNTWTFACRRAVVRPLDSTVQLYVPPAYSPTGIYPLGSIVTFNSLTYVALVPVAAGNEPDIVSGLWGLYFGPRTVLQWGNPGPTGGPAFWSSATSYALGALVIGSDGNEYASLLNGNSNHNPVGDGGVHWQEVGAAPTGYGYFAGELVYYPVGPNPGVYMSLVNGNISNPTTIPAWVSTTLYNIGDTVVYSAVTYQSTVDVNVGQVPTGTGDWIAVPGAQVGQKNGQQWTALTGSVKSTQFLYPTGSGPATDNTTNNVYILPNGFLATAPQNPKSGPSYLGGPIGNVYDDWVYADTYFTTFQSDPILLRFVADVSDVTTFDEMFCEGLSCRIGIEVCETLTQSTKKLNALSSEYNKFMGEARIKNAIEQGPTDAPEDDYISVRI